MEYWNIEWFGHRLHGKEGNLTQKLMSLSLSVHT